MSIEKPLLFAIAAALMVAGCVSSPTEETLPPVPTHGLADGEAFFFVEGVTSGGFIVDAAEFLTGEGARAAAVEDGVLAPGEDLPNDFYIRNADETTALVGNAPDATFTVLTLDPSGTINPTAVDYDELVAIMQGTDPGVYGVYHGTFPADVAIEDGLIVRIGQVYLP